MDLKLIKGFNEAVTQQAADAVQDKFPRLVFLWAEQNNKLNDNRYEWSYGNGMEDSGNYIVLPHPGKLVALSLNVAVAPSSSCVVEVRLNNQSAGSITLRAGQTYMVSLLSAMKQAEIGGRVNFRTVTAGGAERGTILLVYALSELDFEV